METESVREETKTQIDREPFLFKFYSAPYLRLTYNYHEGQFALLSPFFPTHTDINGLFPLSYQLDDPNLSSIRDRYVEYILDHQNISADGAGWLGPIVSCGWCVKLCTSCNKQPVWRKKGRGDTHAGCIQCCEC